MILRLSFFSLVACLILGGCEPKEDPLFAGRPLSQNDSERMYHAHLLVLTDGQTTRQEVLNLMGTPDRISDDKRIIMYYWTAKDKDEELINRSFVIAEFGKDDILTRHQEKNYEAPFGGPKLPEDALQEFIMKTGKP